MPFEIDAESALRNRRDPKADWGVARRRLRRRSLIPAHTPSFALNKTDTILTMGSCFARNIEEHLIKFGCRVPAANFSIPANERKGPRPNHALTLFTPPLFSQTIEWAERIYIRDSKVRPEDCEPLMFQYPDGRTVDLGLAAVHPTSFERCVQRRQQVFDLYAHAFTAECIMMTPGLVEAWFDRKSGLYTNSGPMDGDKVFDAERFTFRVLSYEDCIGYLRRTVDIIRKHSPRAKFLVTVSPVPLRATFTDEDILVANTYSKAALRTACDALVKSVDGLDYFPSYEAVTLSSRFVWQKDRRHVSDAFVGKIVDTVIAKYFAPTAAKDELGAFQFNFLERIIRGPFFRRLLPR